MAITVNEIEEEVENEAKKKMEKPNGTSIKVKTFNTFLLAPNCPKVELMMFRSCFEASERKKNEE